MSRLIWTLPALGDLKRLHQFLAETSPTAASRAIKTIQQAILALQSNPEMGRPVEELLPGYRELIIGFGQSAYVALYQFDGNQILILAVRHGREAGY
jgi:plasmid stabilization system protein ParE